MSKEAMKLALEASEEIKRWTDRYTNPDHPVSTFVEKAITALREALAEQPAQQEPEQQEPDWKDRLIAQHEETILWQSKRIAELLDAPQPPAQQEPVAWRYDLKRGGSFEGVSTEYSRVKLSIGENWIPLYTSPPAQRTWVDLTDEGIIEWVESGEYNVITNDWASHIEFARAIEAKLKEKNNV